MVDISFLNMKQNTLFAFIITFMSERCVRGQSYDDSLCDTSVETSVARWIDCVFFNLGISYNENLLIIIKIEPK